MNTLAQPAHSVPRPRVNGLARNVAIVATKELRDAVRSRWFVLYTGAFTLLAASMSFLSLAGAGAYGLAGFGRTAAGLVNLIMLVAPLMGLTAGAASIAGDRERGMLAHLLAQPVTRAEVLLGKFAGLGGAITASLLLGFGVSAVLLALRTEGADAGAFAALVGLTCLLALAMLAVGLLISTISRRAGVAVALAVFAWLALAFLSDLGLMAGTLLFKLRVERLFALAVANPLQAFKFAVVEQLHASLDVLGPAGLYASQSYGHALTPLLLGVLVAWIVCPLALALAVFARRAPL